MPLPCFRCHGVVALMVFTGCSGLPSVPTPAAPAQTSAAPTPTPAAPVIPGPVAASLSIESIIVDVIRFPAMASYPASFGYEVRFLLRERGGRSGATIRSVSLPGEIRDFVPGFSCLNELLRVPPGGSLDVFYSEEGVRRLGYCAPSAYGFIDPVTHLELLVTFTDDTGRGGEARAVVPVTY